MKLVLTGVRTQRPSKPAARKIVIRRLAGGAYVIDCLDEGS